MLFYLLEARDGDCGLPAGSVTDTVITMVAFKRFYSARLLANHFGQRSQNSLLLLLLSQQEKEDERSTRVWRKESTTAVQALYRACIVTEGLMKTGFKSEWHHIAFATLATVYRGFRFLAREQVSSTRQSQRRCFFSDKAHFLGFPLHLPLERRCVLHPAFLV